MSFTYELNSGGEIAALLSKIKILKNKNKDLNRSP